MGAEPRSTDAPSTTRKPTATRRIPQKAVPDPDPEQAAEYKMRQQAALAAAQLNPSHRSKGSSGRRITLAVLAGIAMGSGGVFAYHRHLQPAEAAPLPPATAQPTQPRAKPVQQPAPPTATTAAAAPAAVQGKVAISPPSASVTIDGKAATVSGGELQLSGTQGTSYTIELAADGKSKTFTVTLGATGPEPAALKLDLTPVAPPPATSSHTKTWPRPMGKLPNRPRPVDDDIYE